VQVEENEMDWEGVVDIETSLVDLKAKKISNYGYKTFINWYRPDNSRVRHLVIKRVMDFGCHAACGFSNCRDPHHIDDSPKCKSCLKLTETL